MDRPRVCGPQNDERRNSQRSGIDSSTWAHGSDHCMVGIRVNFTTMVGRVRDMPTLYKPTMRTVMAGQQKSKTQYRSIATKREQEHTKQGKGLVELANTLLTANTGARQAPKHKRKQLQERNDRAMKKVVKELLAIEQEQEQAQAQSTFGGSRARHKWCDVFSRRNGIYNLIIDVIKKKQGQNGTDHK